MPLRTMYEMLALAAVLAGTTGSTDMRRPTGLFRVLLASTLLASALAVAVLAVPAWAEPRHGLSTFGELKYKPDFKHFDFVNPGAPKGGRITLVGPSAVRTFDSFNRYLLKGDPAQGLGLLYDSLMAGSSPEPAINES